MSIGIGTFGSDLYSPQQIAEAVIYAAEIGQRSFEVVLQFIIMRKK